MDISSFKTLALSTVNKVLLDAQQCGESNGDTPKSYVVLRQELDTIKQMLESLKIPANEASTGYSSLALSKYTVLNSSETMKQFSGDEEYFQHLQDSLDKVVKLFEGTRGKENKDMTTSQRWLWWLNSMQSKSKIQELSQELDRWKTRSALINSMTSMFVTSVFILNLNEYLG